MLPTSGYHLLRTSTKVINTNPLQIPNSRGKNVGKIENMLDGDERIVKSQSQVQLSSSMGQPWGTLYLTNKRIIFLVSRGWSLASLVPSGALVGKDMIIPLESVRNVKKGFPSVLTVEAQKKHEFVVPSFKSGEWVDAVLQECALSPPPENVSPNDLQKQAPPNLGASSSASQQFSPKFCGSCGNPLNQGNKFCVNCGTPT